MFKKKLLYNNEYLYLKTLKIKMGVFMFNKKQVNKNIEEIKLSDIVYTIGSRKEIIRRNFLAGIFRGIGIGIGVTVVTAIIITILQRIIRLNIPIISDYIVDIVEIVENNKKI